MLNVASVCTPCCLLLDVVASCCAKFETGQTFQPTTPNIVGATIGWFSNRTRALVDDGARKLTTGLTNGKVQGGETFCASFCASLIAGSRQAFLCVDCVCLLLEFRVKYTRCERLLPVKHFYLTCLLFFRRLKITLDSEQPMLKEKRIIPSVWGGIKGFEHFLRGEYFSACASD